MDLQAYLARIEYDGSPRADLETLRGVLRAHGRTIPYENLDVLLGRRLTTDPEAAYTKLVTRRRGGWCYEMNGVLGLALQAIGFPVTRLRGDGTGAGSHLVVTVDLDGQRYVTDVGFGDGPPEPYPLVEGEFRQDGFTYRVERQADGRWYLHNHRLGMVPGVTLDGPDEAALAEQCAFLQSSPTSPFVQNAVVTRRGPGCVLTMLGRVLRTIRPDGAEKVLLHSADEYVATLEKSFGLALPEAAALWPAICARHEQIQREKEQRRAAGA
jgi:N-hydroxyarylamine O-acetyltransferase